MEHLNPNTVVAVLGLLGVLGGWLWQRVKPKAIERAELITRIAEAAAAVAISIAPGAAWALLLDMVVKQLKTAGVTSNNEVMERAAALALTRLGKNPGAPPR